MTELKYQSYLCSDAFKRIRQVINNHCAITELPQGAKNELEAKDTIRELQDFLTHDETVKSFDNTDNKLKKSAGGILCSMEDVCRGHKGSVFGHLCTNHPAKAPSEARDIILE